MSNPATRYQAREVLANAAQTFRDQGGLLLSYVLDRFHPLARELPASERHHHSWPFGLIEHSLEVALGTLAAIADAARRSNLVAPLVAPTLTVALLHDLGKVFAVDGSDRTWRRGRGFLGHPDQAELILTLTPPEWAVPVKAIAERYDSRFRRPRLPEEPPLDYLADAIARADGQSAWRGRIQHPDHGRYLDQLLVPARVAA
jgi:hypothetical protein